MANQALTNLKKIHDLQKDGEISQILKEIRNSKIQVEAFSKQLKDRKNTILNEMAKKQAESEVKKEENSKITQEQKTVSTISPQENKTQFKKFDNTNNNQNKNNNKPPFDRNKAFNRENKKDNNRQFNSFNKNNMQKKNGGNNFVSTKTNNFRSFASNDLPEIDFKAERNIANKNKYAQKKSNSSDEKK